MAGFCLKQERAQRLRPRLPSKIQRVCVITLQITLDKRSLLVNGSSFPCNFAGQLRNSRIEVVRKLKVTKLDFIGNSLPGQCVREQTAAIRDLRKHLVLQP